MYTPRLRQEDGHSAGVVWFITEIQQEEWLPHTGQENENPATLKKGSTTQALHDPQDASRSKSGHRNQFTRGWEATEQRPSQLTPRVSPFLFQ